jgi:hypothetical protein
MAGRKSLPADPLFPKRKATILAGGAKALRGVSTPLTSAAPRAPETPAKNLAGNGLITDIISVNVPAKPPVSAPETDTYFCLNCKGDVAEGDITCPTCEHVLAWGNK